MGKTITLRRGYDIKLEGLAEKRIVNLPISDVIAVKPSDFHKIVPKVIVEPGEQIKAGQTLFLDKLRPELRFTSPGSGEIAEIVRGEKRRIKEIRIIPDKSEIQYIGFPKSDPKELSKDEIVDRLLNSGCWNYIRQRPFSTIAEPQDQPKSIFVSCFDSSPLAPDLGYIIDTDKENFRAGLIALSILSQGHLHIGLRGGSLEGLKENDFSGIVKDTIHYFYGPHPSGNVGIQIHHIDPIQKGEIVWFVHPQDVMSIGRLFTEGRYRADRILALTGHGLSNPQYVRVITGQKMKDITGENLKDHSRLIQGNVLHGRTSSPEDFLSFYENQMTAIPEGDQPEFLGWLLPGLKKLSLSRTYFSWLFPKRRYSLDTNMHGEERAFVMTGQYDKVLPMNIYPVFLLKAILAKDIENMEALGIYEVAEEDFALCEFVCTSKIDVQKIITEGLELIRTEG
ncbi:MAG: Na(+)-translocating NADH-quinone reductase subunit A [Saprospiraceae bacterium]